MNSTAHTNHIFSSLYKISLTPKFLLVLLSNNTGHSRKYNHALYFLLAHRTLDENICPD